MRTRLGKIAANGMLVVIALLATGLIVEIGVRVYSKFAFSKMTVLDDALGWRHATDVSKRFQNEFGEKVLVVQDAYGNRGPGHPLAKPAGKVRILALGDSFTEGIQVSETELFTAQIEKAEANFDVVNAGVGGYGTVQEYLYLKSEGMQFHPDLVLLMFYENDLSDNLLSYSPGIGPRPYATIQSGNVQVVESIVTSEFERFVLPLPFAIVLNKYSYVYGFLNTRVYQPLYAQRMRQLQQSDLQRLDAETRYHVFFAMLDKLTDYLQKQSVSLVVVLIPTSDEVASGRADVHQIISEHCLADNINCLSLIERFHKETSTGAQLYFREDIHWTAEGHKVAADEILKYLRSKVKALPVPAQ